MRLAFKEPLYVTGIEPGTNAVRVGEKEELYTSSQTVVDPNWIAIEYLDTSREVKAKIRNAHQGYDAVISPQENGRVLVAYEEPQIGAAPGQAIVFYDKDVVVGGGIVE